MIKEMFGKFVKINKKPEIQILPGNLAFSLVLSLIPIITLFGLTASFFSISIDSVIEFMSKSLPKDVSNILIPFIDGEGFDFNIGIFMIAIFFIASNGPYAIIVACNTIYNVHDNNTLRRRIKAIFLTIIIILIFIFIVVVLAFGNKILKMLLDMYLLANFSKEFYYMYILIKWPLSFLLIYFSIKLIYTLAPDFKIGSKYVTRGAVFTTLGWIFVTLIYAYYVNNIAHYDIFYSSLSNIIVLMTWIYILAYIFVVGMAINASTYQMVKKGTNNESKKV